MQKPTIEQAVKLIDNAANEDLIYHFNGAQTYMKLNAESNILVIIDTAGNDAPSIELCDGTHYFETYKDNALVYSERMRKNPMSQFFQIPVNII